MRPMHQRILTLFALSLILSSGLALADVKVVKQVHQDGFTMMGQTQPATDDENVIWIANDRMRMDQGDTSTLVRLDLKKMYVINHPEKTYYSIDLPVDVEKMLPPGMGEQMMAMMQFDVTITPKDETRKVGSWTAKRYDMSMSSSMMTMTSTLWATTETPIDIKDYQALYEQMIRLRPGMEELAETWNEVDGFVVAQEGSMTMSMMGNQEIKTSETTTSIEEANAPAGTYDPPSDYQEQPFDFSKMMKQGR